MAQVGTHYADAMVAVDVSDIIYQITPADTPLYNATSDTEASGPVHEWSKRSLTTRSDNAALESFTYSFSVNPSTPSRIYNVPQIVTKEIRVSNSEQAFKHYAISDLFGDQMALRMVEYKTDIEHALWTSTLATGTSSAARRMQGLVHALTSGVTSITGTDGSTQLAMSETFFNDIIQQGWELGAEFRDVFTKGYLKRQFSGYSGSSTRYIAADDRRLVKTITEYDSDFFTVSMHLSRDIPANAPTGNYSWNTGHGVVFSDLSMMSKAWVRRSQAKQVPETGDSVDGVIVGELTLEYGTPLGHYFAAQVTGNT